MLNPQQKKAVETTEGRVLILAGAGSGKTSVLTHRIAHLIRSCRVSPKAILGLTFTNKAAEEMRKRVGEMIGSSVAKEVTLCTFHSFCMQVLRKEIHHLGFTRDFSLYDEKDVQRLLSQLVRQMLEHEGELPSLQATLESISLAKNKALTADQIEGGAFAKDLFSRFQTCLRAYNAVDFDSLLSLTLELFEAHPNVLGRYQERFRYLMIDEYQDTNPTQYKLASLLAAKHNNLCVVGDDDQAIYSWRGADIRNILNFEAKCTIKLEQNFRSTPIILQGANAVIRNNAERHQKQMWSEKNAGELITVFHAPTDEDEAQAVIQRMIHFHCKENIPWKEMAILYRSNHLSRPFELALMQASWQRAGTWVRAIPYRIFGGTEFYERSEIKDLAAYLRVVLNPLDQEAILRIINVPRRGVSDQALDLLTKQNRSQNIPLWEVLEKATEESGLSDKALKGVKTFVSLIKQAQEKFKSESQASALKWLTVQIDYDKAIMEEVKSDKMQQFKRENVAAFIESLAEWQNSNQGSLHDFLATFTLDNDARFAKERKESEDKVNLMTFHSAKGLEFSVCFLVCLEDQLMPHEKSVSERGLEEERRLMYVAMTRAKKRLILSMARRRKRYGKEANSTPSRFLFEIPKEILKSEVWNAV